MKIYDLESNKENINVGEVIPVNQVSSYAEWSSAVKEFFLACQRNDSSTDSSNLSKIRRKVDLLIYQGLLNQDKGILLVEFLSKKWNFFDKLISMTLFCLEPGLYGSDKLDLTVCIKIGKDDALDFSIVDKPRHKYSLNKVD